MWQLRKRGTTEDNLRESQSFLSSLNPNLHFQLYLLVLFTYLRLTVVNLKCSCLLHKLILFRRASQKSLFISVHEIVMALLSCGQTSLRNATNSSLGNLWCMLVHQRVLESATVKTYSNFVCQMSPRCELKHLTLRPIPLLLVEICNSPHN